MAYVKKTWENKPSTASPINANNLNHIEGGIYDNDIHIDNVDLYLQTVAGEVNNLISDVQTLKTNPVISGDLSVGGNAEVSHNLTVDGLLYVWRVTIQHSMSCLGDILASGEITDGTNTTLSSRMAQNNPTGTGRIQLGTGAQATGQYGMNSIAIGTDANAIEMKSVAIGNGATAGKPDQIVLGSYNETDSTSALIFGGGEDSDNRRTLLKFDASTGNAEFYGEVTDGTGNTLSAKANTTDVINMLPVDTESGNPCVITDGYSAPTKSLKLTLEPIQDLHGYSKPWSGGSGKNLLPLVLNEIKTLNTSGSWSDDAYTINGVVFTFLTDNGGNITSIKVSGTPTSNDVQMPLCRYATFNAGTYIGNGASDTYRMRVSDEQSGTDTLIGHIGASPQNFTFTGAEKIRVSMRIQSMSGTALSFTYYPMIRLSSASDATFEPYTNICPISGLTEAEIMRTGVNLWDEVMELGDIRSDNGNTQDSSSYLRSKNFIPIMSETSMYFRTPSTIRKWLFFYDANYGYLGSDTVICGNSNVTFSSPINACFMKFLVAVSDYGSSSYQNDICINISNTNINGQYFPFVANDTFEIALGQTAYGGTLDVTSGVLTIDRVSVNLGTLSWTHRSDIATGVFASGSLTGRKISADVSPICEAYGYEGYVTGADQMANKPNGSMCFYYLPNTTNPIIYIKDTSYSNADTFKTAVNGVYLCYELATPTTVQLTPTQIALLHGDNVLTTDADNIDVEYPADIALYIAKKIAEGISQGNRSVNTSLTKGGSSEATEEVKKEEIKEEEIEIKEEEPLTKEVR